jgi:hypothetical protein
VEDALITALCERVSLMPASMTHSDTRGPKEILSLILNLTEQDFVAAVGSLPSALLAHKETLVQRNNSPAENSSADESMKNGKFIPDAAFGDPAHFHKGLEIIGLPSPKIEAAMLYEFNDLDDSRVEFEAWNSGRNVTCSAREWEYVVEPFVTASIRRDTSPRDWQPKHSYGSGRTPMRLEVFLHALSVQCSARVGQKEMGKGGMHQYGDFKTAAKREMTDPLWLHEEEVALVKLILLRFIKSQLDSVSLRNALKKGGRVMDYANAQRYAEKVIALLSSAFHETADASFESVCSSLKGEIATSDIEELVDYFHLKFAGEKISRPEVIAVRLYTGPPYVKLNASLRAASGAFDEKLSAHLQGNNYVNTIYAAASGLRKLSFLTAIPRTRKVYRGMAGYKLPQKFEQAREGGGRGGVEFAFMSTTTKLEVAVSYIPDGKALPMLFEFEVGDVDRGSSVSFISQYPGEEEVLIPPLSFLEIVGDNWVQQTAKGPVTVYPARINCNLKSRTVEEIEARRKVEFLAMKPYLLHDLRQSLEALSKALSGDGLLVDDSGTAGYAQVESEFRLPDFHKAGAGPEVDLVHCPAIPSQGYLLGKETATGNRRSQDLLLVERPGLGKQEGKNCCEMCRKRALGRIRHRLRPSRGGETGC